MNTSILVRVDEVDMKCERLLTEYGFVIFARGDLPLKDFLLNMTVSLPGIIELLRCESHSQDMKFDRLLS